MSDIYILSIDTATEVCSVALSCNGKNILCKEQNGTNMHSQILLPYIDEVLQQSGIAKTQLSAIAVSEGPGSYTGLRIGVSTAYPPISERVGRMWRSNSASYSSGFWNIPAGQ